MSRQLAIGRTTRSAAVTWETVNWDKWSFRLPPKVSPEGTASLKQTFYSITVHNIDASEAPPTTKSSVLATRFPYSHHITEAETRLRNLLGRTVGHASTIDLTHDSFTFRELVLRNTNGVAIPMMFPADQDVPPDVDPANIPPASRRHGRYLSLQLQTNVIQAYVGEEEEATRAKFQNSSFHIAIQLPIGEDGGIHQDITRAIMQNPRELIVNAKRLNQDQDPLMGSFRVIQHNPLQIDAEGFRKKYESHVAEQVYRLHKAILRREYLGQRVFDPSQFIANLLAVKQLQADPSTGKFFFKSVNQYHTDFTQVLNTWDPSDPLPLDVVQTFWSGLKSDIQNRAISTNYTIPGIAEGQAQEDMLNRLRVVKEKAELFAQELKETTDIVNRAIGRSVPRNPRTSFQSPVTLGAQVPTYYTDAEANWPLTASPYETPITYGVQPPSFPPTYMLQHEALPLEQAYDQEYLEDGYTTYAVQPMYAARPAQPSSPYEVDVGISLERFATRIRTHMISATSAEGNQRMAEDAMNMSVACASLAEEALKKATGEERPPLECWGCANHPNPLIKADRFHRFFDCPRKASDPTVREAGEAKLRQFMEERRARRQQQRQRQANPYGPVNTVTTEAEAIAAGHHSVVAASLIATIARPDTSPEVRMACYKNLADNLSQASTTVLHAGTKRTPAPVDTNPKDPKSTSGPDPEARISFHFMPESENLATVMQAMSTQQQVHLEITQVLPHVRLPIGDDGKATLFAMIDSGAGLNLGRLQYHQSIAERCPELVQQFAFLKDSSMKEFGLGQVGEGPGPRVTAVISYKTPFMVDGRKTSVSFGLSDSVTCNSILGFPFLKAADAIPMFGSNALILQKLGKTLNMDYQRPPQADTAPQTSRDCQMFTVTPKLQTHVEVLKSVVVASFMAGNKLTPGAYGSPEFEAFVQKQGSDRS
jgi:hypothetical protein